jgi:hypothetical protein
VNRALLNETDDSYTDPRSLKHLKFMQMLRNSRCSSIDDIAQ